MVTREDKIKVCEKYNDIIEFIYLMDNGIILQKQFYILCEKLNLTLSNYHTRKILNELEEYQIIKRKKLSSSNYNVLILRKFAFIFIFNKKSSSTVSPSLTNIDKRVRLSILKADKLIKLIDNYNIYYIDNLLDLLYDLNSNILYKRCTGYYYHLNIIDKFNLDFYNQYTYFKAIDNYNTMLNNLSISRACKFNSLDLNNSNTYYKYPCSNTNTSKRELCNITIDNLINLNTYIQSISTLSSSKIIEIAVFDTSKDENINKLIKIIDSSCYLLKEIFKNSKLEFRFIITSLNKRSQAMHNSLINKYNVSDIRIELDYVDIYY